MAFSANGREVKAAPEAASESLTIEKVLNVQPATEYDPEAFWLALLFLSIVFLLIFTCITWAVI